MNTRTLLKRSLTYYTGTHLAVVFGVAIGAAMMTGALVIGDSVRQSLRDNALARIGRVDFAVQPKSPFRETLISGAPDVEAAPVLLARGTVLDPVSRRRSAGVTIIGVTNGFWKLDRDDTDRGQMPEGGKIAVNARLAKELDVGAGDELIVTFGQAHRISTETLLGRRDRAGTSLRAPIANIVPSDGLGGFTLEAGPGTAKNVFVPLADLQQRLDLSGQVNGLLVATPMDQAQLSRLVEEALVPADLGISFRVDEARGYIAAESEAMLIPPNLETALINAGKEIPGEPVLAHLANTVTLMDAEGRRTGEIPYSTVAAISPDLAAAMPLSDGSAALHGGGVMLNDWAAADLDAGVGDKINVKYYLTGDFGKIEEHSREMIVRAIASNSPVALDPGWVPAYPGITDTRRMTDWDPPFPVDLSRVRDKDEAYWEAHRTAPKLFVDIEDGVERWAEDIERFGQYTSIRYEIPAGTDAANLADRLRGEFLAGLTDPVAVRNVRDAAEKAGGGSTDFAGLFVGFSFFLITAAAMLVALIVRLSIVQRLKQIGLLSALGFTSKRILRMLLAEALILSIGGSVLGILPGILYARAMIAALTSSWVEATNAPFLALHVRPVALTGGAAIGILVGLLASWFSLRGLRNWSPRSLLAARAETATGKHANRTGWKLPLLAAACVVGAAALTGAWLVIGTPSTAMAFFGGSALLLLAGMLVTVQLLKRQGRAARSMTVTSMRGTGVLGLRNVGRRVDRSTLTIALIAAASFLLTSLQAFRLVPPPDTGDKQSGTGGFALFAESSIPLVYRPGDPEAADTLNLSPELQNALQGTDVIPFRLHAGDETSCLSLYRPTDPRIIGAPPAFIERGGFRFAGVLDELTASDGDRPDPWRGLEQDFGDAIPAIGDESAVLWQLHSGLGKTITVMDERGREVTLKFVALLAGSALQSEIIISEQSFERMYPSENGYGFFMIGRPRSMDIDTLATTLERDLEDFGFDVGMISDRVSRYFAVQNTYLSAFQTLGGLGLILGSLGLTAVLLRNFWERRAELALLIAVGYRAKSVAWVLLVELGLIVTAGLLIGTLTGLLAVAPQLAGRSLPYPWGWLLLTVGGVLLAGILPAMAAMAYLLRRPLVPALRSE